MVTLPRLSFIGTLAVLALALPARSADVDKLLPDHTEAVLTLNVKQMLHGGLVKKYGLEPMQRACKDCRELQTVLETLGIDPFQDIDRVVAAAAGGKDKSHAVVIVHGRFDTAKFQAGAKTLAACQGDCIKVHKEGEHRFYEVVASKKHGAILLGAGENCEKSGCLAPVVTCQATGLASPLDLAGAFFLGIVDKGTVVLTSDKEGMLDAFDRAAGSKKPSLKKAMRHAIEESDSKQSVWLVANVSTLAAKDAEPGAEANEDEEPARVGRISGGVTLADDVRIHLTLTAVNTDAAKEVMKDLDDLQTRADGLATLLAGTQKECACLKDIPKAFQAIRKGKTITLEGQLDADPLEQVMGLLQKAE